MAGMETDSFELKRMMRQEAHEKAFEIQVMGQRIFEKEKDKIVQQGIDNLQEDVEKKLFNLNMNLNIEKSTKINATRLLRMKERNECMKLVKKEAKENMLKTIVHPEKFPYKQAVRNLIIQVPNFALTYFAGYDKAFGARDFLEGSQRGPLNGSWIAFRMRV